MPQFSMSYGRQIAGERRTKRLPAKIGAFVAHTVLTLLLIAGFMVAGAAVALSVLG
jgi:hypothetical protein